MKYVSIVHPYKRYYSLNKVCIEYDICMIVSELCNKDSHEHHINMNMMSMYIINLVVQNLI